MKGTGFLWLSPNSIETYQYEVDPAMEVNGHPRPDIKTEDGRISVWFDWSDVVTVDRPVTYGIATGSGSLGMKYAERIVAATRAGKAFVDAYIKTDIVGNTYVEARCLVWGKRMNADLKRLGF